MKKQFKSAQGQFGLYGFYKGLWSCSCKGSRGHCRRGSLGFLVWGLDFSQVYCTLCTVVLCVLRRYMGPLRVAKGSSTRGLFGFTPDLRQEDLEGPHSTGFLARTLGSLGLRVGFSNFAPPTLRNFEPPTLNRARGLVRRSNVELQTSTRSWAVPVKAMLIA